MLNLQENILKESMLRDNVNIKELKMGDIVRLKEDKFAIIISDGEIAEDVDYGTMYKNIKRFELIDSETYYILWLEKERDRHEKEIFKHKKDKFILDARIYLTKKQ